MNKSIKFYLKQIAALLGILAGIVFLSHRVNVFPLHDFVEYWSAGRINLTGGNPYSPNEMFNLQKKTGWKEPDALMMWNPPWLLALAMPFSILDYPTSRIMWFLLELFTLFFSADMLWQVYEGNPKQRWIAWLAVLSFGPTLQTLKLGQITSFVLLGCVGFIFFIKKGKPFRAGVMASLVLLKPHLLFLFAIAVLLWSLKTKIWKVLAGIATGIILPFFIASFPNIRLISQYLYAYQNYPPEYWQTATLGTPLRTLFGIDLFFLQFVPSILGVVWLLFFWLKNNHKWNWSTALPLIVVFSTATTAYGWAFDVSVIVVAVIQIVTIFNFKKWTIKNILIFSTFWIVSLLNTFSNKPQHWFWWLSSFFLVWYIFAHNWLSEPQPGSVLDR